MLTKSGVNKKLIIFIEMLKFSQNILFKGKNNCTGKIIVQKNSRILHQT
jgi:hypothetical protein